MPRGGQERGLWKDCEGHVSEWFTISKNRLALRGQG